MLHKECNLTILDTKGKRNITGRSSTYLLEIKWLENGSSLGKTVNVRTWQSPQHKSSMLVMPLIIDYTLFYDAGLTS